MNLLDLVLARNLQPAPRKVSGTHSGEWHSPCPVCGGKNRFHFWPERPSTGSCSVTGVWGCRGCDKSGDAIGFLMHAEGIGFKEACKRLGQPLAQGEYKPARLPRSEAQRSLIEPQPDPALPPAAWMQKNAALAAYAHETLLQTPEQLAWLAARGLDDGAVKRFRLGWLPGGPEHKGGRAVYWYTRALKAWGLPVDENAKGRDGKPKTAFSFARGLTIPRFTLGGGEELVSGLRIRRPAADRKPETGGVPDLKYQAFKGAPVTPLLIPPRSCAAPYAVAVVEAELDAMLLAVVAEASNLNLGSLALCSNTARPTESQHKILRRASRLLLCLDFDPKGSGGREYTDKALHKWLATYPAALDWPVPQGKDPGEAFALGVPLAAWLLAGLPASCLPRKPKAAAPEAAPGNFAAPAPASAPEAPAHGNSPETAPTPEAGPRIPELLTHCYPEAAEFYALLAAHGLRVKVGQNGRLGLDLPRGWASAHPAELARASGLLFRSDEVNYWLSAHQVQSGFISADNFMLRQNRNQTTEPE